MSTPRSQPPARRSPRVIGGLVAALLVTAIGFGLLVPLWPAVTVDHDEDRLAAWRTEAFTLSYIHSIDGLPIEEDLRVTEGELVVERTRLKQFGAGMGHIDGEGQGRADGDWWVVDDLERDIGSQMHLRAGATRIDHRITSAEHELRLSVCLPGERITISAARVSTLTLFTTPDDPACAGDTYQNEEDS